MMQLVTDRALWQQTAWFSQWCRGRRRPLLAEITRSRSLPEAAVRAGRKPMTASQGSDQVLSTLSGIRLRRSRRPEAAVQR